MRKTETMTAVDTQRDEPSSGVLCVGVLTLDVLQTVERLPADNEKLTALSMTIDYGGPAANAAGVAAGLGLPATLLTVVGTSPLAQVAASAARESGVETVDCSAQPDAPFPVSSVLINANSGSRAVISTSAAGQRAGLPKDLSLSGCGCVLLDGHQMELGAQVATLARRQGVPVLLDGGSWKPGTAELLPLVDVALVSADFLVPGLDGDLLEYLNRAGCLVAAQSHGSDPLEYLVGQRRGTVKVPQVAVVDTTGAGDCLHGALAFAIAHVGLRTDLIEDLLRFASQAASFSCLGRSARGWLDDPTLVSQALALLPVASSTTTE